MSIIIDKATFLREYEILENEQVTKGDLFARRIYLGEYKIFLYEVSSNRGVQTINNDIKESGIKSTWIKVKLVSSKKRAENIYKAIKL